MNNYYLNLSSNNSSTISKLSEIELNDLTTLNISLSGLVETPYPLYLAIDWGDGTSEKYENTIFKNYRTSNIIPEILYGKFSSIFQNIYQHTYKPSTTTLYKKLTAQCYVEYSDSTYTWFLLPIEIRSYGYFEAVGDMRLYNTNILPLTSNGKQHQFITDKGGFLVEIEN